MSLTIQINKRNLIYIPVYCPLSRKPFKVSNQSGQLSYTVSSGVFSLLKIKLHIGYKKFAGIYKNIL